MTDTAVRPAAGPGTVTEPHERGVGVAVLFAVTSFVGATLLFMVQPLAAKLVLPSFGGSATVWSTSSLFFQVLLLLGYLYAHLSTRRLGAYWQPRAHLLVLALPLLALPVALPSGAAPETGASPALWLLVVLATMVGLPFLVLSATGPLIQRWYSWSRGPRADDPYFLFAGSNLGSFVGLLSYPFVIEPHLSLTQQRWTWSVLLGAFLVLMAACAVVVRAPRTSGREEAARPASRLPARRVLSWCALAFLPSCLMLAVTAHISTDVAPIPLIWVLPLAVYLASFVAAFARRSRALPVVLTRAAVASAVLSGVISLVGTNLAPWLVITVDLTTVALVSYAAHARLAATRPEPQDLTGYYLVISVGGALGGLVNGVVAPMVFNRVWEYGLSLAAVPLLMIGVLAPTTGWITRRYHPAFLTIVRSVLTPVAMLAAATAMVAVAPSGSAALVGVLLPTAAVAYAMARNAVALTTSLLLGTVVLGGQAMATSMELERTFYGSYRVLQSEDRHVLVHGTTVHGSQLQDGSSRDVATGYYAESGPLGDVMAEAPHRRAGIIGLGTGTIAAYGDAGDRFTFYEIDPVVRDIAQDPDFFTFLADTAATTDVRVGDGRLELAKEADGTFDLIVLDAFSSDAIPVHLLTREAMREYAERLTPSGSLVVHISNRVFGLEPVLRGVADDLGWTALRGRGSGDDSEDATLSEWVVLTPDDVLAGRIAERQGWRPVPDDAVVWTDDYASVLSVLR